jgi:hypothetical protein
MLPSWFEPLKTLQILDLTQNHISDLPVSLFTPLTSLRSLYLDKNAIKSLLTATFGQHNLTRVLTIDHNGLTSIEPDFFTRFPSLEYFHATDNVCIDGYIHDSEKPINFNDNQVLEVLSECFDNHETPGMNKLIFLYIGLGVAVGVCCLMYGLHFYFVRGLEKREEKKKKKPEVASEA